MLKVYFLSILSPAGCGRCCILLHCIESLNLAWGAAACILGTNHQSKVKAGFNRVPTVDPSQ